MAVYQYQVEYGATYATLTSVATNVQNVQFTYGRQRPLDAYSADTASVTMRYPTGYASPNALWITGTYIRISGKLDSEATYSQLWVGRIADVTVQYGIPYSGGVGNADFVTLNCEGYFANFGRVQGGSYAMAANLLQVQCNNASNASGLSVNPISSFGSEQTFPATTVSGTWGDWVNRVVLTLNGRMIDTGTATLIVNPYYKQPALFGNFSDTINDIDNHSFNQLAFSSYADNWYTQVTVTPESFGSATVQTGSAPYRTYQVNTLNASTAQADDYARYLLSTYKDQKLRILSVTCLLNDQITTVPKYGQGYQGTQVTVTFRGTTYQCVIEGGTWSGTPTEQTATFYLSAQDLNNYLILNNAVYGKLDSNKLGY